LQAFFHFLAFYAGSVQSEAVPLPAGGVLPLSFMLAAPLYHSLPEKGMGIHYIKYLPGHFDIRTTEWYVPIII
jgi:hypothetical protein